MDTIILNSSPVAGTNESWKTIIDNLPLKHLFENGTMSPVVLDLMFANKPFTPFHKDESYLNGKEYQISREAMENCLKNGHFKGLPLLFFDRKEADHGIGNERRKPIGYIHDAILREDDRGTYVQALAGVYKDEFDFSDIEENQIEIGGSPEFGINKEDIDENGIIKDFSPRGVLILDKENAAFKDTQLYCSDIAVGEDGDDNIEDEPCDDKPNQGGLDMSFCEKCAPIAESEIKKQVDAKIDEFKQKLQQYAETQSTIDEHKVAASDANKQIEEKDKEISELKEKVETLTTESQEKDKKALEFLAARAVEEQFQARKEKYPEEKHDDVKKILYKIKCSQATEEEILNLTDWQITKGDGGSNLDIAAGDSGADSGDKPMSDSEIEAVFERSGVPFIKRGDGK